jgi:hypothetical protein
MRRLENKCMQSGFISQCRKSVSAFCVFACQTLICAAKAVLHRFARVGAQCAVFALLAIARKLS